MELNMVKIGRAELLSRTPKSLEVNADIPLSLTNSNAAAMMSSFVNFGFGGMPIHPFLNHLFCIVSFNIMHNIIHVNTL